MVRVEEDDGDAEEVATTAALIGTRTEVELREADAGGDRVSISGTDARLFSVGAVADVVGVVVEMGTE
jgi:hypothetical protein